MSVTHSPPPPVADALARAAAQQTIWRLAAAAFGHLRRPNCTRLSPATRSRDGTEWQADVTGFDGGLRGVTVGVFDGAKMAAVAVGDGGTVLKRELP